MNNDNPLLKAGALLPLKTAARICFAALYRHRLQDVPRFDERLAELTQAIMDVAPVYLCRADEPLGRQLQPSEWKGAALADLHIARDVLDEVIAKLTPAAPAAAAGGG